MGKTRGEIQKAYRQRKKAKEGAAYLKKECDRVKTYYKPTTEIGPVKLRSRRERVRNCMRKKRMQSRQAHREIAQVERQDNIMEVDAVHVTDMSPRRQCNESSLGPCDSTTSTAACYEAEQPSTSSSESQLVVKLNFNERRGSWKKLKAVKKSKEKVEQLELKVSSLKKRNDALRKQLRRVKSPDQSNANSLKCTTNDSNKRKRQHQDHNTRSPKSTAFADLRQEGLSPTKFQKLARKLTFHNTMVEEVKEKVKTNRGRSRQRSLLQVVCGKVMKKYRFASSCSRELGVDRRQISKSSTFVGTTKSRSIAKRRQTKESIITFFEREDNSACLPGKRDATKLKTGYKQTRVLNDYLYNLHLKYKAENPENKLSLTSFASFRPSYIKLVKYSSRRTCLCQKHQNIALKVKGMKAVGASNTDSPDMLIRQNTDDEILQKISECEAETIKFSEWKRKDVNHKGKLTKRMMIENVQLPKTEFMTMFRRDLIEFRKHVLRVKCQYEEIKKLKEKLPQTHAICQMDFAENYSCGHAEEIQTAYFDKCSVTLHPVVIYTRDPDGTLKHISYIYVSDTQAHNSGTVYAFLKHITEELKSSRPDIECVHYITDSPTSQYRNKTMMYVVANHDTLFGTSASWQYWEAGHGKGPCDGVGGASKRQADLAVKRHSAVIQTAREYYNWGKSETGSHTRYVFVPKAECEFALDELSKLNIKPVKGTMEIHSVVQVGQGEIAVRSTSCFCDRCFENGKFTVLCSGWTQHSFNYASDSQTENDKQPQQCQTNANVLQTTTSTVCTATDESSMAQQNEDKVVVNDYVAAVYNDNWYVGKVISCEPEDDDLPYQVSFMEHGKGKVCHTFRWPRQDDSIWRQRDDILCVIGEPIAHGTRNMFRLNESDLSKIITKFEKHHK